MRSFKWIAVLTCAGVMAGAFYVFAVAASQRELVLVAKRELSFYDGVNRDNVVFRLPAGQSVNVIRCDYTNKYFEPVIRLEGERTAHFHSGDFALVTRPTGWLSLPRYLDCGDR